MRAYRDEGFPVTIVRPSHTYDRTSIPLHGGYTAIDRMRKGKKIVVHGDGTSLWVMTHHRDFAKGFVGSARQPTMRSAKPFTSRPTRSLPGTRSSSCWRVRPARKADVVHIPSDTIARFDKHWGDSLLGDKAHSMVFDNTKIKRLVPDFEATIPFSKGVEEIIAWYDADPARQVVDERVDEVIDRLIERWESAWS